MNDKWIDDIRESLSDYEMDVPAGLWESLGVDKPVAKPIAWRRNLATAAAVIVLLIIGSGYFLWQSHISSFNPEIVCKEVAEQTAEQNPYNISNNSGLISQVNEASTHNSKKGSGIINHSKEMPSSEDNSVKESVALLEEYPASSTSQLDKDDTQNNENVKKESQQNHIPAYKSLYEQLEHKQTYRNHSGDRYALAISASGLGSHSQRRITPGIFPGFNDPLYGDNNDHNSSSPGIGDDPNSDKITDIHHHLPIKVGVTVQYNMSKRIGIESGLTYSVLESDITVSQGNRVSLGSRKMQYIGIPINLKISAWSWKFINVYLSAGIIGEKCIGNKFETKSLTEGISLDAYLQQREKPFQWSANAAVGLQISPTPLVGIFAEPGVSYYFNDGTPLSTIYKDRPCNFNLNLGIRFNLNPKK